MAEKAKIVLKSGKDQSLRRRHPWIFSGAIKKMYGNPGEGDIVEVFDNKDEFLACGHYQIGSIAVRVLSFKPVEINADFWFERISSAYEFRKKLGLAGSADTNVFRLIHAEGDPGAGPEGNEKIVQLETSQRGKKGPVYRRQRRRDQRPDQQEDDGENQEKGQARGTVKR